MSPELIEEYFIPLRAYALKIALRITGNKEHAEDLVQDTYIRLMRTNWNPKTTAKSLLSSIIRYVNLDRRRDWKGRNGKKIVLHGFKKPSDEVNIAYKPQQPQSSDIDEINDSLEHWIPDEMYSSIMGIREDGRKILLLRVVGGLEYSQIGKIVGNTTNTVNVRMSDMRKRLRNELYPVYSRNSQMFKTYLKPGEVGSFDGFSLKEKTDIREYICPVCSGHGGWNLELNAYGTGKHFQAHCSQCEGYGWVFEWDRCVHDLDNGIKIGNCLHRYTCKKCGITKEIDSGG